MVDRRRWRRASDAPPLPTDAYPEVDPLCAQLGDPDAYFPEQGGMSNGTAELIRLCASCPLREPCLVYALAVNVEGIWAGTTARQRGVIRSAHHLPPVIPVQLAG